MIYIITTETFPNGLAATQRIRCYARSVVSLGYVCKVICINRCEDPSQPLGNTEPKGVIDGYEYSYIGGSTLIKNPLQNKVNQFFDTIKLVLLMLSAFNKKDIVILYSYNPLLLKLVVGCSRIKGYRVFFELNEHPSVLRSLFGVKGETQSDLSKIKRKLESFDGVLCISSSLKRLLVRCGLSDNKSHVVNMLVDTSRFACVEKQKSEPYIGYCGAADNNKDGVDKLIKSFSLIAPLHPNLKLYIMGPKTVASENEELSRSLGIQDRVFFTGMVSPDKMPQMLVDAKVLALARPESIQAQYGFPTKLGEYLLSGNPVVVTAVGDIPLFLENEVNAYLAEPDNIDVFVLQLEKALTDSNAKEIGMKGRSVAEKFFSETMVKSQLSKALNI